jgi:hypothetical protein
MSTKLLPIFPEILMKYSFDVHALEIKFLEMQTP